MITGGKPYYAAVFGPVLIAAGAVAVTAHSPARSLPAIIIVTGLILVPISTPLLPISTLDIVRRVNPDMAEMVGWPELVDDVAAVYQDHPGATILARNYSEAGSIEVLGAARGLPQPISGHNTYWYWGHPSGRSDETITVGFPRQAVEQWFGRLQARAHVQRSGRGAQRGGRRADLRVPGPARRAGTRSGRSCAASDSFIRSRIVREPPA